MANIMLTVELTQDQAEALAHFLKRHQWADLRKSASTDEEAHLMREALNVIQYAQAGKS